MILKTNLHFHSAEDEKLVPYGIYQYIDRAQKKGFDVLAYTPHRKFLFKEDYAKYAGKKGILLIPGIEMEIKKKHIVVLNCGREIERVKSFQELSAYKNENPQILIMAPHPFVFSLQSLGCRLLENIGLFDVIEMSIFSNKIFNFNKKAAAAAQKNDKPFIATSDTHFLKDLGRGHASINAAEKSAEAVFSAIKKRDFQNKMNSMNPLIMLAYMTKAIFRTLAQFLF